MSCCILHNILLRQSHEEVEDLLQVLRNEGLDGAVLDDDGGEDVAGVGGAQAVADDAAPPLGTQRRQELGVFLTLQRRARR